MRIFLPFITLLLMAAPVHAQSDAEDGKVPQEASPLPPAVQQMLDAALAEGDEAEIAIVAKYAKGAVPGAAEQIEAMVSKKAQERALAQQEALKNTDIFALWKGRVELGGFRSTGSTSEFGVSLGLSAERRSLRWRHALRATVDYRRANGKVSRERMEAAYAPRFNFNHRGFLYGLAQYERDPAVGYDARYTGSAGIGYQLVESDTVDLALDAGPSLRHSAYVDGTSETKIGLRSSAALKWGLTPTLSFKQTASAYVEEDTASLSALSAFDAKLISVLTARLSYNVQYETDSRLTSRRLDTLSKVTLIYDF